ncbi:LysR family transcriptional regulator [Cellulomonas sp. DKR-3]|uniref:LysR family transcriptional regulator n=1 Tax=Cellulomonas fulva TaxID=2835530 RepID=A0ABS5U1Z9_9CELL|nr:LysR family transcriptional regulator [Cellulomonas fulva]MBT0995405.1 LysR family transcriptional regulator [Cellulomonas fulva]
MADLTALRVLVAVDRDGSISAAARALGLSQQAVSQRVRGLEREVGARLVARSTRGSALTETGRLVAAWAGEVVDAATRFDVAVEALRAPGATPLRVAASLTVAEYLLPAWLVRLRAAGVPGGDAVELTAVNSAGVVELVRAGSHDVGFVETPHPPEDLRRRTLGHDELVVVVGPDHAWARRATPLTSAELAATPLVTREPGSGTRAALEAALARHLAIEVADLPRPLAQLPTTAAVRATVAAGAGPAVLSLLAVRDALAAGSLRRVPLADLRLTRPLSVVWSPTLPRVPDAARALLEIIAAERTRTGEGRTMG